MSRKTVHRYVLFLAALLFNSTSTQAAVFTLPVLDPAQIEPIFDVLASTIVLRTLEPPSHPSKFGLWFNARANGTVANSLSSIANSSVAVLPFGNLQAGLNGPFGLGIEFGFFPSQSISGTSFGSFGTALKWNFMNPFFKVIPFDAALRFQYTKASLNFEQTIETIPISVDYSTKVFGITLDISKNLKFFEPYIGYGILSQSSSLAGQGTVSLFNENFPVNTNTVEKTTVSGWLRAGFELRLFVVVLGMQYDRSFGTDTYSAKFGFKF
jgi:hypothetical protein